MRLGALALLSALLGCTYNVTDDARLADIIARQNSLEQRQDALEGRLNTQAEQLGQMRKVMR